MAEEFKKGDKVKMGVGKQKMIVLSGPDENGEYICQGETGGARKVDGVALEKVTPRKVSVVWLGKKR